MADDKSSSGKGASSGGPGKRPYATLDLKATEIKDAPAGAKDGANAKTRAQIVLDAAVPLPLPAVAYAARPAPREKSKSEARMQAASIKPDKTKSSMSSESAASSARTTAPETEPHVVTPRRSGFFTHLAAGVIGGILAFLASQWALPELGLDGTSHVADSNAAMSERIAALETKVTRKASAPDLTAIRDRLDSLDNTVKAIPELSQSQKRLVAETKAALAAAASDAGSPELIERLGKVEDKLMALADAGANDPNSGRVEQLAALTAKITDLETSRATELSAMRAAIAKDVDTRIQSATVAAETAHAGIQRLDTDVAGIKTDATRLDQSLTSDKSAVDAATASLNALQSQMTQLKAGLEGLQTTAAKPADIASAIAPLAERTAALEKSVQQVTAEDTARSEKAKQIVLALELQNLKRAADAGRKFKTELDEVKKLAGDSIDLAALTEQQDAGVPSLADLKKDFRAAANGAIDADAAPAGSSVVDRLWAEAKSVVRVRRTDLKPSDKSTEATIGRMQVDLDEGRLADVLDAAKDLSPNADEAMRPFLDKVTVRVGVDNAIAGLEAQLKSSIASNSNSAPKPQQP
jgi:hypothetical protein